MDQPKPYEFRDSDEIAQYLSRNKVELGKNFDQRIDSLEEIIRVSVSGNTFRAFRKLPQKPSVVFRGWALVEFQGPKAIDTLTNISSQPQYDEWAREFSDRLSRTWKKEMGTAMPYGPSRKLPNLILKCFLFWSGLNQSQRDKLINYLHVPLDSFTLVGIRNCINDPKIPRTATMNFIDSETKYNPIQQAIRDVTRKAEVPAIYFDMLAWDMGH